MEAPKEEPDQDEIWEKELEQKEVDIMNNPYGHLEGKTLDELNEHEDEVPDDDLEKLRRKRLEMLKNQAKRNKYGTLVTISEPEYKAEVANAEKDVFVVVFLYCAGKEECTLIERILITLAAKFKDVKFVKIEGNLAIRNWPDENCPSLFVYHGGDIKLQFVGLNSMGGARANADGLEWALSRIDAVKSELTEDPSVAIQRTKFNRLDDARRTFLDQGEDQDDWLGD